MEKMVNIHMVEIVVHECKVFIVLCFVFQIANDLGYDFVLGNLYVQCLVFDTLFFGSFCLGVECIRSIFFCLDSSNKRQNNYSIALLFHFSLNGLKKVFTMEFLIQICFYILIVWTLDSLIWFWKLVSCVSDVF